MKICEKIKRVRNKDIQDLITSQRYKVPAHVSSSLLLTGSKRQSHADFESDFEEPDHRMTEEHVKFLQWYYRTEDRKSDTFYS